MRSVTVTTVASSSPIGLDQSQESFNVGLAVIINSGGSGGAYTVDYTYDDIDTTASSTWTWFSIAGFTTGTRDGTLTNPARAVRLTVSSLPTGGTTPGYTMQVRQAGSRSP